MDFYNNCGLGSELFISHTFRIHFAYISHTFYMHSTDGKMCFPTEKGSNGRSSLLHGHEEEKCTLGIVQVHAYLLRSTRVID